MRRLPSALQVPGACALLAVCALLAAGCGSSSSSSSSSPTGAAVRVTGAAPAGSTTYNGSGFTLAIPAGWRRYDTGHALIQWTPASSRTEYSVQVLNGSNRITGPAKLSEMRAANKQESSNIRMSSFALSPAHVPGARSAWLITARGSSAKGPHSIDDLVVETSSGAEIDVSVTQLPGAASFDSLAYLRSLKLAPAGSSSV